MLFVVVIEKVVRGDDRVQGLQFQQQLLERHLSIAINLGRPVSLHCVQTFGDMLRILT